MENLVKIMVMLDWNQNLETQAMGRELSKTIQDIKLFLQPSTPQFNKNVWENCAIILSERNDDELKPYLIELMEWLQDMNWPGALCIFERLCHYNDKCSLKTAISICINNAKLIDDVVWEHNLGLLPIGQEDSFLYPSKF